VPEAALRASDFDASGLRGVSPSEFEGFLSPPCSSPPSFFEGAASGCCPAGVDSRCDVDSPDRSSALSSDDDAGELPASLFDF